MIHAREDYNKEDLDKKIPKDEPVFLIRGQDLLGEKTVRMYADLCRRAAHGIQDVEKANNLRDIAEAADSHADKMGEWAKENGKYPDSPPPDREGSENEDAFSGLG